MRIGMLLAQPFPPDIRVEKEAKALNAAGFEVGLLCLRPDPSAPSEEITPYGLQIYRVAVPRPSLWTRQIKGITLMEKGWLEPLRRFIDGFQPHVLHVHDFPLLKTGLTVAEPMGLPVVADLHENMPAAVKVFRLDLDPVRRAKDILFRNSYLWHRYEKQLLPRCARVIVVVPEAAERFHDYGLGKDRITVVSNTEDETTFGLDHPLPEILEHYQGQWIATYVGGVASHRGLDTAIQAVPEAAEQIPNFRLVIVGAKGERQTKTLLRLVRHLHVEEKVEVLGWQPFEKVSSYIAASAVCLVPHNDSEFTRTTVPHKLFQYMLAGKPVVVSSVRPLKRIVEETKAGLVFEAGNPSSLARAFIRLYQDAELSERLGHNGRQAATGVYAWRHDAQRLIETYRDLERIIQNQKAQV
jgi:glycosyltransferase involved in cell wall biosynthesis